MTTRELQAKPATENAAGLIERLAMEVTDIAVALIDHDPNQPRKTFDPETIRELAENIRQHGLLHPLHLRCGGNGRFILISGARRLEAMKLLGWTHAPAVIHAAPLSTRALRLLQVSENLLKEDVNPMEQALAFQECQGEGTASQLAQELGVATSTITRALELLRKLPPEVQELVRNGQLPGTVAREITSAPNNDAKCAIARRYVAGELKSRAEVIAAVRSLKNGGAAEPGSFVCNANGIRIAVSTRDGVLTPANAEAALREVAKDLHGFHGRPLSEFQQFLEAKAAAARKADELKIAQNALAEKQNARAG